MSLDPLQALRGANRPPAPLAASPFGTLLIAGATGALGQELLHRLAGSHRHAHVRVLVSEPMHDGLPGVESCLCPTLPIPQWPPTSAQAAIVAFDAPRLYHGRERALWLPDPAQLPALARWLRSCGVQTLVIVQPHDQGRLPEALKRGLANLDEQSVVGCGFERVLILRSARKPAAAARASRPERLAAWMLSTLSYMVPSSEQPVRPSKLAELVDLALRLAPPGVHIAAPEVVWRAAQPGRMLEVARDWLGGAMAVEPEGPAQPPA